MRECRFYQAGRLDRPKRPPSVQSRFAQLGCYLRWGDVIRLLRGHYSSVVARTGSCAAPVGLSPPSAFGLVWRVLAGCNQSLLPTAACRVGRGVTTPTPHRTGRAELPLTGSSRESFAHGGVMSNAVRDSLVNCQFSYPLTFRVRGCEAQSPLPCPVSGPLLATPPFP